MSEIDEKVTRTPTRTPSGSQSSRLSAGRQPLHPIDKALDEGQRMFELSGGDVAAAMRYAVIQAWAAGWDAGVRQGRDEKQRAARFTETVKAEIEASRRRFADLPERVIDGELAQGDGR